MSTKTYQAGNILDFTAPAGGVTSGVPLLIGALLVVPQTTAAAGASFAGSVVGVHSAPKATGTAWTEGAPLYWDVDNEELTTTRLGRLVAHAAAAAGSSATTGYARLAPSARPTDGTLTIADDDSAASNGTAVYVVAKGTGAPYLASVCAGNADTMTTIGTDDLLSITDDDDAATLGTAVYFDEDADQDSRLRANTGADVYIPTANGRLIRIVADATPSGEGVQVYVDDNGGTASERLLFVSPTNADGSVYARGGI